MDWGDGSPAWSEFVIAGLVELDSERSAEGLQTTTGLYPHLHRLELMEGKEHKGLRSRLCASKPHACSDQGGTEHAQHGLWGSRKGARSDLNFFLMIVVPRVFEPLIFYVIPTFVKLAFLLLAPA
jgi:hypothetical protein